MALMVTKCKKAAILPRLVVMVPMTATQAQVDAIIETMTRMRRTAWWAAVAGLVVMVGCALNEPITNPSLGGPGPSQWQMEEGIRLYIQSIGFRTRQRPGAQRQAGRAHEVEQHPRCRHRLADHST